MRTLATTAVATRRGRARCSLFSPNWSLRGHEARAHRLSCLAQPQVTYDLYKKYGEFRLLDTPICEYSFMVSKLSRSVTVHPEFSRD